MTRDTLIAERDKAAERVEALKIELGHSITTGNPDARSAVYARLVEAQAEADALAAALQGVEAAEAADESERTERERQAEERKLVARLEKAERDIGALRKAGGRIDAALAELDDALTAMAGAADKYLAEHRDLGLHRSASEWLQMRAWTRNVALHFLSKANPDLRRRMRDIRSLMHADFRHKPIGQAVPPIEAMLTGRSRGGELVKADA